MHNLRAKYDTLSALVLRVWMFVAGLKIPKLDVAEHVKKVDTEFEPLLKSASELEAFSQKRAKEIKDEIKHIDAEIVSHSLCHNKCPVKLICLFNMHVYIIHPRSAGKKQVSYVARQPMLLALAFRRRRIITSFPANLGLIRCLVLSRERASRCANSI